MTVGRRGYTLLETAVALVAAGFLIVGLAAAMGVSSAAVNDAASTQAQNIDASAATDRVASDLRHATGFTERTSTAATFTVPDRDGDNQPETIRYSWSGIAGDPLNIEYNGGPPATLAPAVQQFGLSWLTRSVTGTGFAKGYLGPSYDGITEKKYDAFLLSATKSIAIDTPTGTSSGDLLIAAISVRDDAGTFAVPAGWNTVSTQATSNLSLAIFWKAAGSSELSSHTFNWSNDRDDVYGWMMRFTGQHPTAPIDASGATALNQSATPTAPSLTATVDGTLVVRIAAIRNAPIIVDTTGLIGHETITMDHVASKVSGGAGYQVQTAAGPTGTAEFVLTGSDDWIAATIVIAPAN